MQTKEYKRADYLKNRERYIAKAKQWAKDNPERLKATARAYQKKNRAMLTENARLYREANPDKRQDGIYRAREYYQRYPWLRYLANVRWRCSSTKGYTAEFYANRGIKCLLTKEDIKTVWDRDKAGSMEHPSIDRIDSNGHYQADNVRFIERKDNARQGGLYRWHGRNSADLNSDGVMVLLNTRKPAAIEAPGHLPI